MDVFDLRDQLIGDYRRYGASFMALRDRRIRERVQSSLDEGTLWPEPSIGLNPAFEPGGWIDDLVAEGLLHPAAPRCPGPVSRSRATREVSPCACSATRSTPSGRPRPGATTCSPPAPGRARAWPTSCPSSTTSCATAVGGGVKAIVVYPMNALANSQAKELEKFLVAGAPGGHPPVTFQHYTGQESRAHRLDVGAAAGLIRAQLMAGYRVRHPDTGFPAFAFRLHQFISKGDTVFASVEAEETRHLTLNGQRFVPGHRDTVLLPLSFCRQCGQEYYTAHRILDGSGVSRRLAGQSVPTFQAGAGSQAPLPACRTSWRRSSGSSSVGWASTKEVCGERHRSTPACRGRPSTRTVVQAMYEKRLPRVRLDDGTLGVPAGALDIFQVQPQ